MHEKPRDLLLFVPPFVLKPDRGIRGNGSALCCTKVFSIVHLNSFEGSTFEHDGKRVIFEII